MRYASSILMGALLLAAAPVARAEPPRKQPFQYNPAGRRDPFVSLLLNDRLVGSSSMPRDTTKPTLYGILWDPGGQSIALIDDLEAKVGDTVRGYKVKTITRDEVVLEAEGQTVVLQIAFDNKLSEPTTEGVYR